MVHNFKGKLLLTEESPAEQQRPNTAMLNIGRMESPLEKYIASQVRSQTPSGTDYTFVCCGESLIMQTNSLFVCR